ncbi:MAG: SRPBCC family protein [Phycisphaerae bacterium]|nr:SRPBCC family protein [Phycisphaerae bacterium]
MTRAPAKLKVTTPNDLQIVMMRAFDAPRRLMWDAMTKPDLLRRWMFCPPGWAWAECEVDVRVGGRFRWAWNGPDGRLALSISGEHREVPPPARIVHTERMEMGPGAGAGGAAECGGGEPGGVLVTLELAEQGGQTQLTMTISCPTKHVRDAMLASGMEHGVEAGYQQLDAILAEQSRR